MRDATHPVNAAALLAAEAPRAWAWDWFALMRRLEALEPAMPRWGRALRPAAEPVRVGQEPSLAFAPASIQRFELPADGRPPLIRQHFFAYIGPNGPLPVHLSDFIRERALNHGDRTWLAFLDTFLHRFSLHLYRAWAQARPAPGMDRPGEEPFRHRVGALVGIGGSARRGRDEVADDARLHFAGWLARQVHCAEGVASVLGAYFGVPLRLERWVGHWMPLPDGECTRLGAAPARPPARLLGGGAVLGVRVWDRQHKVRLHLGPLTLAQYRLFLPVGTARPVLGRWMQQLLGDALAWDGQLVLCPAEVPPTRLGTRRGSGPRLGWESWLGARPHARPAQGLRIVGGDVRFQAGGGR